MPSGAVVTDPGRAVVAGGSHEGKIRQDSEEVQRVQRTKAVLPSRVRWIGMLLWRDAEDEMRIL